MDPLLIVEGCDFQSFPVGGQLTKVKHYMRCLPGVVDLVGVTSDKERVGRWSNLEIEGKTYALFGTRYISDPTRKPLIPRRITFLLSTLFHARAIRARSSRGALAVSPEGALAIHFLKLPKCLYESSGVGNPLLGSRYRGAGLFAKLFERVLFAVLRGWPIITAAADDREIQRWVDRSKGQLSFLRVHQSFTSFDSTV